MKVENAVYPKREQVEALLNLGGNAPITMLNLLKFKDEASYAEPDAPRISGRKAYMRYANAMRAIVEKAGGRFIFSSTIDALVVGEVDELWDMAAIVEYPSRAAFAEITRSPEVLAIGVHRQAGLAGQLLIQCTQQTAA